MSVPASGRLKSTAPTETAAATAPATARRKRRAPPISPASIGEAWWLQPLTVGRRGGGAGRGGELKATARCARRRQWGLFLSPRATALCFLLLDWWMACTRIK